MIKSGSFIFRRSPGVLCGLILAVSPSSAQSQSPIGKDESAIANAVVQITYDLGNGTFNIVDLVSKRVSILAAHTEVETWSSLATNCSRQASVSDVTDALGKGRRLTVRCSRPDGSVLLAEFTIHGKTNSAVTLRAGLENKTGSPLRIKEFHPLAGGLISGEHDKWTDVRMLNGDSACNQARVTRDPFLSSANNLLLTFKQNQKRRSLVLGGLKTSEFMKWAHVLPEDGLDLRGQALDRAFSDTKVVGYLDCGMRDRSRLLGGPVLSVETGQPYTFPAGAGLERFGTVIHDGKEIVIRAEGLDPTKTYALGFSWWDFDANGRVQSVIVRGKDGQPQVLFEKRSLPMFHTKNELAVEMAAMVPGRCYADGTMRICLTKDSPVANVVVSEVWLWEMGKEARLSADWAKGRPVSPDQLRLGAKTKAIADLEASDPVGKLVDAGTLYLPEDSFYVDCITANPFEALEEYGRYLRAATGANPHFYDFPTICAWYAGVWKTPGAQNHPEKSKYQINTTTGLVEELQKARDLGFFSYSRVAGRLVPDTYEPLNPQGWWDDAHWRSGGYYVAPYDTTEKYGHAMHQLGGLAFTYIQPTCLAGSLISKDFREQHVDWLCGKDVHRTLDYTHPATQKHLRKVFGALRGAIDGIMVDYCDDLWAHEAAQGGFADKYVTSTAFYRSFFKLIKDGLGPDSWLHERNLNQPNNDLTLGIVDLQRTSWDTDKIAPEMVSRSGLRWYKNRVVLGYDMDSKELTSSWKAEGFNGSDEDGRRMMLTMAYVASSRLLLANSFRDLSSEVLHDLSRTLPYPQEARSARPIDAFVADGWPRVYNFAVNPKWHQLTLYNNTLPTKEAGFTVPLSGELADGAMGLDVTKEYYCFDFWNEHFIGRLKRSEKLSQTLRPGEARMISVHEVEPNPQFISTSRHLMQGYLDMARQPTWNEKERTLSGASQVVGGETYRIVIALNSYQPDKISATGGEIRMEPFAGKKDLLVIKLDAPTNAIVEWKLVCRR